MALLLLRRRSTCPVHGNVVGVKQREWEMCKSTVLYDSRGGRYLGLPLVKRGREDDDVTTCGSSREIFSSED